MRKTASVASAVPPALCRHRMVTGAPFSQVVMFRSVLLLVALALRCGRPSLDCCTAHVTCVAAVSPKLAWAEWADSCDAAARRRVSLVSSIEKGLAACTASFSLHDCGAPRDCVQSRRTCLEPSALRRATTVQL